MRRIAIIGVGGVGGYFGARLVQAGLDVTLVARGQTLEALHENGLRLRSTLGDVYLPRVQTTDDFSELAEIDLVFVAVKGAQLPIVAERLASTLPEHAQVIPLLNGIHSAELLSFVIGGQRVFYGFCRILSRSIAPGHIDHFGDHPTIFFGGLGHADQRRESAVAEVLAEAPGMSIVTPGDIRLAMWQKFILIAPFSVLGAATGRPVGDLREHPATRHLLQDAVREIVAVGQADGVPLPTTAIDDTMGQIDGLPATATASMQRDINSGRASELVEQISPVLHLARAHSVPAPIMTTLYAVLIPSEERARDRDREVNPAGHVAASHPRDP